MATPAELDARFTELEAIVEKLPEGSHAEIAQGLFLMSPSPAQKHQITKLELCRLLADVASRTGGWRFLSEVEIRSAAHRSRLIPDVSSWKAADSPDIEENPIESRPPFWVAEVLSPTTEPYDRGVKAAAYAAIGVAWMWLVDPKKRTVEVFENAAGAMTPRAELSAFDPLDAPPFGDLVAGVARLFPY
jgi:Uma2 family endonuclease